MGHAGADEESAVGATLDGEVGFGCVAFVDEVFAASDEIIICVLAANFGSGFVPGFSVLRSATNIGEAPDSAHVHPDGAGCAEPRGLAGTKSAVGVHEGGVLAGELEVFAVDDVHRHFSSVGGGDEGLFGGVLAGVEGEFGLFIDVGFVGCGVVAVDDGGGCEIRVTVVGFVGIGIAGESADGTESREGNLGGRFAAEVEGFDLGVGVLHVLDNDARLGHGCAFDCFGAGGHDIGEGTAGEGHGHNFASGGIFVSLEIEFIV